MRTVPRELLAPESLNASTNEAMAFVVREESLQQGGSKNWEQRHRSLARLGLVPRTSLQDPPLPSPGHFFPKKIQPVFSRRAGRLLSHLLCACTSPLPFPTSPALLLSKSKASRKASGADLKALRDRDR